MSGNSCLLHVVLDKAIRQRLIIEITSILHTSDTDTLPETPICCEINYKNISSISQTAFPLSVDNEYFSSFEFAFLSNASTFTREWHSKVTSSKSLMMHLSRYDEWVVRCFYFIRIKQLSIIYVVYLKGRHNPLPRHLVEWPFDRCSWTDAKLHPRRRWLKSRHFKSLVHADNAAEACFLLRCKVKRHALKWLCGVLNNLALIWIFKSFVSLHDLKAFASLLSTL